MKRARAAIAGAAIFCGALIGAEKEITETLNVNGGIRWGLNGDSPHVTYLLGFTLGFRGEPSAQAAAAPTGDKR
jgi:hypothetical protein